MIWINGCTKSKKWVKDKIFNTITLPGKYSYDVYIWHQIIIAFLYYSVFQTLNIYFVLCVIGGTVILSLLSVWMRNNIKLFSGNLKRILFSLIIVGVSSILSMIIYLRAGVVRDIPELDVYADNVYRHMHAEYNGLPYSWDKDFCEEDKIKVLVIGNSFARDFANILNESEYVNDMEISYIYGEDISSKEDRIKYADIVFWGTNDWSIPTTIIEEIPEDKLYIVGNKLYGNSNGIIYAKRNDEQYFSQMVELDEKMLEKNNDLKRKYGKHYIDMITPVLEGNRVKVFTDNNYYISQDCRHLTRQGAKYYARILNLEAIFSQFI